MIKFCEQFPINFFTTIIFQRFLLMIWSKTDLPYKHNEPEWDGSVAKELCCHAWHWPHRQTPTPQSPSITSTYTEEQQDGQCSRAGLWLWGRVRAYLSFPRPWIRPVGGGERRYILMSILYIDRKAYLAKSLTAILKVFIFNLHNTNY